MLIVVLLALAATYVTRFAGDAHALAGLLVFATPPLLLAFAAWRGWPRASFIAAVCALLWFSHGVMLAWSDPARRAMACVEIVLALVVVYASCIPGMQARRAKREGGPA